MTELPEPVWPASATQALTAVEPFRPAVFELTGHSVQEIAPTADLNFPAAHAATVLPAPVQPASATQSDEALEPTAVNVCSGQAVHAVEDIGEVLYVPAMQAVTAAAEPVNPTSALQSSYSSDAVGESLLAEQSSHCVWPAVALYLPVAQSSQDVLALSAWMVPAEQSSHCVWPAVLELLPAAQSVQTLPLVEVLPAAQSVQALPLVEVLPAAQLVQTPFSTYVPSGQTLQVVFSANPVPTVERPLPAAQHSPLSHVVVQTEAAVTRCVAASQLSTVRGRKGGGSSSSSEKHIGRGQGGVSIRERARERERDLKKAKLQ